MDVLVFVGADVASGHLREAVGRVSMRRSR